MSVLGYRFDSVFEKLVTVKLRLIRLSVRLFGEPLKSHGYLLRNFSQRLRDFKPIVARRIKTINVKKCLRNFSFQFLRVCLDSRTYWSSKMENESPGAVARRRAASGQLPFLMFCDKEILYHGFLCFASIMVTVTQATVLNFFIIAFFRGYYHQVWIYDLSRSKSI